MFKGYNVLYEKLWNSTVYSKYVALNAPVLQS